MTERVTRRKMLAARAHALALVRPSVAEYWLTAAGQQAHGIVHVTPSSSKQAHHHPQPHLQYPMPVAEARFVVWGLTRREAEALAGTANMLRALDTPHTHARDQFVAVPRPPCTIQQQHHQPDGRPMLLTALPLTTDITWLGQQQLAFSDHVIEAVETASHSLQTTLQKLFDGHFRFHNVRGASGELACEFAAYTLKQVKFEAMKRGSAPKAPAMPPMAPPNMWTEHLLPAAAPLLSALRTQWETVAFQQRMLHALLERARAVYAQLPVEFTDLRVLVDQKAERRRCEDLRTYHDLFAAPTPEPPTVAGRSDGEVDSVDFDD